MPELLASPGDRVRHVMKAPGAIETLESRHRPARTMGCLDRASRIRPRPFGDLGDDLSSRGAVGVEQLPALRLDPFAVDEHLLHGPGDVDRHFFLAPLACAARPRPRSNAC